VGLGPRFLLRRVIWEVTAMTGQSATDVHARLLAVIEPALAALDLEVYDLHLTGTGGHTTVQVLVDRGGGVDLDAVTDATHAVSRALDAADPIVGSYVLEVSSPGVERPLRSAHHFERAVGEVISVKYRDESGTRRMRGELRRAAAQEIEVVDADTSESVVIDLASITKARTSFEWGAAPKPGRGSRPGTRTPRRHEESVTS
jgi:ribosome maturation factor RimP